MATPTATPTLTATGTPTATPGGRATPSPRPRPTLAGRLGEQAARSLHKSAELPHKVDVARVLAIKVIFITGQYLSWLPLPVAFFFAISGFSLPYRDRSKSSVEVVSKKSAKVSAQEIRCFNLLHSNRAETKEKARLATVGPATISHLRVTERIYEKTK